MQQSTELEKGKHTGRWTKQEHQRFMYAIMQYGKDWKKVQAYVKTRSGSQVRSHAQKFFNKMNKSDSNTNNQLLELENRPQQQHSQTEFDIQRQLNNEMTPSTPMELVSLIKKHSKQQGGKIKLSELKKTLQQQQGISQKPKLLNGQLQKQIHNRINSFKSMSNILSAYEQINKQDIQQQSFFISITKKYKKLFKQVEDFDKLIDLHNKNQLKPTKNRKRSFTLPQGNEVLSEEEMQQKIQGIKKKINVQHHVEQKKKERRDSESSIILIPPGLNKLSTIQQQPREQEEIISSRRLQSIQNDREDDSTLQTAKQ